MSFQVGTLPGCAVSHCRASFAACTALQHCPMLRFAFSPTGGTQLRIPVTRISEPMEFKPLKHTSKEKTMKLSSHRFFGALSVEGVKKNLPQAIFKGFSENKEMRRFFARCEGMQGKKHRNPLWIPSIFNAANTAPCRKIEKLRLFKKASCQSVPAR